MTEGRGCLWRMRARARLTGVRRVECAPRESSLQKGPTIMAKDTSVYDERDPCERVPREGSLTLVNGTISSAKCSKFASPLGESKDAAERAYCSSTNHWDKSFPAVLRNVRMFGYRRRKTRLGFSAALPHSVLAAADACQDRWITRTFNLQSPKEPEGATVTWSATVKERERELLRNNLHNGSWKRERPGP